MSEEFIRLFTTYTADPDSIGRKLGRTVADRSRSDPLIVATAADIALYPGDGRPPTVEGFRLSTRGFKELTAISHLGPAVASLVRLHGLGEESWREGAERLLAEVKATRAANSPELWRNRIAVEAYRGREGEIAEMVDRACAVTGRYLTAALDDEECLTPETLRRDYLDDGINSTMVATFFLVSLDISFRITRWFIAQDVAWERAMVVIAGRQGRPTAGVTWNTSSVATMILAASRGRLPLDRVYIAPHAPTFPSPPDLAEVIALEEDLRTLWSSTRATVELGEVMFDGYPRYSPGGLALPDISDLSVTEVSEMPAIRSADDMRALVTRLRIVLEDPRQLLSSCVADFAAASLAAANNDPTRVLVPGLNTP